MKFLLVIVIMHGFHIKESKVLKPGTGRSEPTLADGYRGGTPRPAKLPSSHKPVF